MVPRARWPWVNPERLHSARGGWGAPEGPGERGKVVRKRGAMMKTDVVVCFVGTQYYKYPALRFCSGNLRKKVDLVLVAMEK